MTRWTSTEATEHQIQAAYFELLERHANQAPILQYIYAIPNGGLRDVKVAVKLKREGVKRGVPDVSIPIPRDNYHGAYIEFKTPTGALSKDQERVIDFLRGRGYWVQICRSVEAGWDFTVDYLGLKSTTRAA